MMRPQEKVCGYATTFVRDPRAKATPPSRVIAARN